MTRYMLIADIHSNLRALETVLVAESYDVLVCLGDIVESNDYPNECVRLVSQEADIIILGNHDNWSVRGTGQDTLSLNMAEDVVEILRSLDREFSLADLGLLVHANPSDQRRYSRFIDTIWEARKAFAAFRERVCFVGHTHVPKYFVLNQVPGSGAVPAASDIEVHKVLEIEEESVLRLEGTKRYIIDVGSVGQLGLHQGDAPNTAYGSYVVVDGDTVCWKRVEIPVV